LGLMVDGRGQRQVVVDIAGRRWVRWMRWMRWMRRMEAGRGGQR
jgi:hypothetical protein